MVERMLLWDVDGTLVRVGEIGAAVFDTALQSVLGSRPEERIRMSGKTDPQIVSEYLEMMGVEETEALVGAVLDRAAEDLASAAAAGRLTERGRECPGVSALLPELSRHTGVVSTLLTGNIYPNALVKLSAFGLDRWLRTDLGAYGSDHRDRNELVPIAMAKLESTAGVRLEADDVWVIGDTPRDFECARAAGTRCLLVGTGRYPLDELDHLGADALLEDLSDTEAVVKLLTGDIG